MCFVYVILVSVVFILCSFITLSFFCVSLIFDSLILSSFYSFHVILFVLFLLIFILCALLLFLLRVCYFYFIWFVFVSWSAPLLYVPLFVFMLCYHLCVDSILFHVWFVYVRSFSCSFCHFYYYDNVLCSFDFLCVYYMFLFVPAVFSYAMLCLCSLCICVSFIFRVCYIWFVNCIFVLLCYLMIFSFL